MADWHADPPIYAAVTSRRSDTGRSARVAALLAAGEDPNATDWRGYPPLGTYDAWDDHGLLRQLLDGGADPNQLSRGSILSDAVFRGARGKTAEERAHMLGTLSILLAGGADPTVASRAVPSSPLWTAIRWSWVEAAGLLLEGGADRHRQDDAGRDALEWSIQWEVLPVVAAVGGLEAAEQARDRIPDPECDRLRDALLERIAAGTHKIRFTEPGGHRGEQTEYTEFYVEEGAWMKVSCLGDWRRPYRGTDRTQSRGRTPEALLKHIQRWYNERDGPRRDRWRAALDRCTPRGEDDLIR